MLLEDVVAMEEWERTHITWGDWARFALLIATIVFLIIAMCTSAAHPSEGGTTSKYKTSYGTHTMIGQKYDMGVRAKTLSELDATLSHQEKPTIPADSERDLADVPNVSQD